MFNRLIKIVNFMCNIVSFINLELQVVINNFNLVDVRYLLSVP